MESSCPYGIDDGCVFFGLESGHPCGIDDSCPCGIEDRCGMVWCPMVYVCVLLCLSILFILLDLLGMCCVDRLTKRKLTAP